MQDIMLFYLSLCLLGAVTAAQERLPKTCSRYQNHMSCYSLTEIPPVPVDIVNLNLNGNRIKIIEEMSFSWLDRLQTLSVGLQKAPPMRLGARAFRNLPNLTSLDLGGNKMLEMELEVFSGLEKLRVLYLDYNGLNDSILQLGYFRHLVSLHTLILEGNKIEYIRPDPTFYNLWALVDVNFEANRIRQICEGDLYNVRHRVFNTFNISSNRYLYKSKSFDWEQCGNPFQGIMLHTLDISSSDLNVGELEEMFLAMRGTLIIEIKMQFLPIGRSFGFNNIKDPTSQTFSGLADSSVMILDVSHSFIFALKANVFSHLTSLQILTLSLNKINQIENNAFFGLQSLLQLNLSFNLLGEIYSSTFEGLRNVSLIDLQHNHIGAIQINSFRGLNQLKTLNLRDNSLSFIPSFHYLPQLVYFLMGHNRLKTVYGLQTVSTSTFLDFSNNAFTNLDVFYKIMQTSPVKYLLLNENRVSMCTPAVTDTIPKDNQLIHLQLSSNFLQLMWAQKQCLEMFHHLANLTDLLLDQNYLTELPRDVFKGLDSLRRLNLSSNSLSQLSVGSFPRTLQTLDLSKNRLLSPDPNVFSFVSHLDLRQNQYICDCSLRGFLDWLNSSEVKLTEPLSEMYCVFPEKLQGIPLLYLNADGCEEDMNLEPIQLALFIVFTTALLILIPSVLLYNKGRGLLFVWYKRARENILNGQKVDLEGKDYKFDAYLCFSPEDIEWVKESLLENLDSQFKETNRFQLCFEDRDFLPGEDHITNIRDAIWCSKLTVCVVTRRFLKDGWCIEAFNIAQSRLFHEMKDVMVMLVVGRIREYQLMKYQPIRAYIQSRQYFRWPEDPQDYQWILDKLADQLSEKPKKTNPKREKGGRFPRLNLFNRKKANNDVGLQRVATVTR